jgi:bacterioferritin
MSVHSSSRARDQDIYPFLTQIAALRRRARQYIKEDASTPDQSADRQTLLRLLNAALTTELMCVRRYQRHSALALADGHLPEALKGEFVKHAQEEQGHVKQLAERIVQLGGTPDMNPEELLDQDVDARQLEFENLLDALEEDLIAERIAIEGYQDILQYVGTRDGTTRRLFEQILALERSQAEGLATLRSAMMRQGWPAASPA